LATESTSSTTSSLVSNDNSATKRGTKIIKPGSDMNKNAFLKILVAEISNQDPTQNKDSTQYVTQLAQMTSMEQMSNLNNTMSFNSANALIGKNVITNVKDVNGNVYNGKVIDVTNKSGNLTIGVQIGSGTSAKILDFDYNEIVSVSEPINYSMESISANSAILAAASMIGKKGEFDVADSDTNITGTIKGIVKENGLLKLRVQPDGSEEIKVVTLDNLIKLDMEG
jgi:flagellar basal-body rod modification protein FlgD